MKEIHFVFTTLGTKRFILPIAQSYKGEYKIYCQLADKDQVFNHPNVFFLPKWFNLKISLTTSFWLFIPSCIYLYKLIKKEKNISFIAHMTTYAFFPLLVAFFAGVKKRIYFNHGFANILNEKKSYNNIDAEGKKEKGKV